MVKQPGRTMLAKIWDQHVIAHISDDTDLLHIDRHLLHDLGGSRGLLDLKSRGLTVHNPELTFATPDHAISTAHARAGTIKIGLELLAALRVETSASGIQLFDVDQPGQRDQQLAEEKAVGPARFGFFRRHGGDSNIPLRDAKRWATTRPG